MAHQPRAGGQGSRQAVLVVVALTVALRIDFFLSLFDRFLRILRRFGEVHDPLQFL